MALFRAGGTVRMATGQYLVESFDGHDQDGREVYTVVSAEVRIIGRHPVNRFKAVVIPTLTVTGCASRAGSSRC